MGANNSKNAKNRIPSKPSNKKCNCSLYYKYKHCCLNECFPKINNVDKLIRIHGKHDNIQWTFNKDHESQFKVAIVKSKLNIPPDIISIIFTYLTPSINQYYMYCHGEINNYLETNTKICDIWWTHFFGGHNLLDIKMCLFGHGGAGKSALVIRYVTGDFLEDYDLYIEDSYRKQVMIEPIGEIVMDILDTAGQEEFSSMQDRWLRECQIALLCFAINTKNALDECILLFNKCMRSFDMDYSDHFDRRGMVLVGCKMDLMYDNEYECDEIERGIMKENYNIALKLSEIWNIPFIETSALKEMNVCNLFRQCIFEYWIQTQTRSINVNARDHIDLLSGNRND